MTLLLALALLACATPKAVDGDTIRCASVTIRVENIDTAETGKRAKCDAEREKGEAAKLRMRELLSSGLITYQIGKRPRDKYGRTLARVYVNGQDIGDELVREGLARKWGGRRYPWCVGR